MQKVGSINFMVLLINDSYRGLDQSAKNRVTVKERPRQREYSSYMRADLEAVKESSVFFRTPIDELVDQYCGSDDQKSTVVVNEAKSELEELVRLLRESKKAPAAVNHMANNFHGMMSAKLTDSKTPFIREGGERLIARAKAEELAMLSNQLRNQAKAVARMEEQ